MSPIEDQTKKSLFKFFFPCCYGLEEVEVNKNANTDQGQSSAILNKVFNSIVNTARNVVFTVTENPRLIFENTAFSSVFRS